MGKFSLFAVDHILITVVIKYTVPNIEEIPAKCREKIAKSTEAPLWTIPAAKGGYTVQPVPAPAWKNYQKLIYSRESYIISESCNYDRHDYKENYYKSGMNISVSMIETIYHTSQSLSNPTSIIPSETFYSFKPNSKEY